MSIAICTDSSSLLPWSGALSLYARLRAGAVATTSQPSPADFAEACGSAADRGAESVVSIHLDRRTSGTIASAEIAASEAPLPVTVVDTGTVSFGVAVCVHAAAAVTAVGGTARDAAEEASRLGRLIENVFVARAGPGGRIPTATDWTVLRFADGAASVVSTCASLAYAVGRMATHMVGTGERISAAVGYAAGDGRAG